MFLVLKRLLMRPLRPLGILACACIAALSAQERIVLATSTILDGKGSVLKNQQIVIEGSRIRSVGTGSALATYDLRGLTVMPGWIDTHIHLDRYFDEHQVMAPEGKDPREIAVVHAAENAWITMQAGFTTVQSLGSPIDAIIRDRINNGALPGPRVLTSLQPITNRSGPPDALRALVRKLKSDGADVVKLFAKRNDDAMTEQQIEAVCNEARGVGLRAVAHAIEAPVGKMVIRAGCSSIEHGYNADDEELDLMAQHSVYFDPNFLVLHNYLDHKTSFTYGPAMLDWFARLTKDAAEVLPRARKRSIRVALGSDAVAGAHGRNSEEIVYRVVEGKDRPMDAIISATSVAAQSLGLQQRIGSISPGMEADLIATESNPLDDITAVRHVLFVMKGGRVYKNLVQALKR